jgi:hypothetical protein
MIAASLRIPFGATLSRPPRDYEAYWFSTFCMSLDRVIDNGRQPAATLTDQYCRPGIKPGGCHSKEVFRQIGNANRLPAHDYREAS